MLLKLPFKLVCISFALVSGAFAQTLDSFESASSNWRPGLAPTYSDSSAVSTAISTQYATDGSQSLELKLDKNDKPKATFFVEKPTNLDGATTLSVDVFNPGVAGSVALALSTGGSWEWFESEAIPLKEGQQTIQFDLTSDRYKSAKNNWNYGIKIANQNKTERVALLFFPNKAGSVFIDNLRAGTGNVAITTSTSSEPESVAQQASTATQSTTTTSTTTPASAQVQAGTALSIQSVQTATVLQGVELTLQTDAVFENPYDPNQADMMVQFTAPSGKTVQVPAFYYQDFDLETVQSKGNPVWKVRYTPLEAGDYTVQASLKQGSVQSAPVKFTAQANPTAKGFIRVDPENPRYFSHDNGDFFLPIGLNIAWSTGQGKQVLDDYRRWFDRFAANGGNFARIWMAPWGFSLEWKDTGLGNYKNRMQQAFLLDQVFKMAEERGIQILLCVLNHGQFSATINPEWDDNPYNVKNGGMLNRPEEFVSNEQAKTLFKQRMRYIAARYSYSPNLFAWEWWNEVNWTPISDLDLRVWIPEMNDYLLSLDPNKRMISNSHASGTSTSIWNMPELSFSQQHDYSGRDAGRFLYPNFNDMADLSPNKPVLLAEIGFAAAGADDLPVSRDEIQLHNALWSGPLSGFASTGMYWWWDNFIDPKNHWTHFKGVADFFAGEDLSVMKRQRPATNDLLGTVALGMQSENRALVWVRNNQYEPGTVIKLINEAIINGTFNDQWKFVPEPVTDLEVTVNGLKDGPYQVKYYDPQTNQWLNTENVTASGGSVLVKINSLSKDLAFKVVAVQ